MATRIELADDHALIRQSFRQIVEKEPGLVVAAEASTGMEAIQLACDQHPDVAVVDIGMPDLNGIAATAEIVRCSPGTAVLMVTIYRDERYIIRSLQAGARGYVLKDAVESELVPAIQLLSQGKWFLSPDVVRILQEGFARERAGRQQDPYDGLTKLGRQIYQWLAEGLGVPEIAGRLVLDEQAVEAYRKQIMQELNLQGSSDLLLSAVRRGILC